MYNFTDAKVMAKLLRQALAERALTVSHSDSLELVARQFGFANWNMLSARIAARSVEDNLALPPGWFITGHTDPAHYRLGLDPSLTGVAVIESRFGRDDGVVMADDSFGVLMQSVAAPAYRGRRLRLSAQLSTEDANLASIWMRVDEAPGRSLAFDNMLDRPANGALAGTQGWVERSIVLDVPVVAATVHYGFLLNGHGRVLARAFRLETVGEDVPLTTRRKPPLAAPANLDFLTLA